MPAIWVAVVLTKPALPSFVARVAQYLLSGTHCAQDCANARSFTRQRPNELPLSQQRLSHFFTTRASRPNAVCSRECASGQARSDWLAVTARSTCASHRSAERRSAGITQCQKIFRSTLCMALLVAARGGRDVRGGAWACASRAQMRARAARVARGPPPPSLRRAVVCVSNVMSPMLCLQCCVFLLSIPRICFASV